MGLGDCFYSSHLTAITSGDILCNLLINFNLLHCEKVLTYT